MHWQWIEDHGRDEHGDRFDDWLMVLEDGRILFSISFPDSGSTVWFVYLKSSVMDIPGGGAVLFRCEERAKNFCESLVARVLESERYWNNYHARKTKSWWWRLWHRTGPI
jgi:hypothetical protein